MYRLMVVDDEEIITDSLYEVLSTKFDGKLELYKAYSAREALSLLNSIRLDIVLTDIKMPGKSGIELMHDIVKRWPKTKVIFLTGHSEFEYAYTAIQQSNVKFILKTEHYNVITQTINATLHDIDKENELSLMIEHSVVQNTKNSLLEQELILKSILYENVNLNIVNTELKNKFERSNIELRTTAPVMLVLGKLNVNYEGLYGGQNNIFELISNYWSMYMDQQFQYSFVKSGTNELIWLVQLKDDPQCHDIQHISKVIEGNLELVQSKLLEHYHIFVSFTITENPVPWNTLNDALIRLRSLQRLMLNEKTPLLQIDYSHLHQFEQPFEQVKLLSKIRRFSVLMETGKQEEIKKLFEELEKINTYKLLTVPFFTEVYYTISVALLSYINKLSIDERLIDLNHLMRLDSHITTKAAIDYLYDVTTQLYAHMSGEEQTRTSLIMTKVCAYIETHLSEDLSLVKLAEIHYFNPSYLSRIFKQECGINISEYIEQRRILLAQQLLRDSELKIRDISVQVGYEAAHSFTRFFKKVTGMTPQEYRDSINF